MTTLQVWLVFGVAAGWSAVVFIVFAWSNKGEMFKAAARWNEVVDALTESRKLTQAQSAMFQGLMWVAAAAIIGFSMVLYAVIDNLPEIALLLGD